MPNLIVHIGPGKCGSTSIQQFFGSNKNPCNEKIHFHLLDPIEIKKLNCTEPTNSTLQFFKEIIKKYSSYCDVLILSHESLFNHPDSIKHLCEVASGFTSKTSVIGYSRRQSDLLVSAYSQWFFRSLKLNKKINIDLRKMEVDTLLFSGLEKLLIAFIENDFYDDSFIILDMYRSYQKIENLIKKMNVEVFCGILPNKKYKFSLIQDFCSNANLTLRNSMNINRDRISNKKFNQEIIEALNNALSFGIEVPGPHAQNNIINLLSDQMGETITQNSDFLLNLKFYIDSHYSESNQQLSNKHGLDFNYFKPNIDLSKKEIKELIKKENLKRSLNKDDMIEKYRKLSATMVNLNLKIIDYFHKI